MSGHILSTYDDELNELRRIIVRMGEHAANQLTEAMKALRNLDAGLAENVRLADKELDMLERTAERAVIGIFARRAPVADDLREVMSALKMTAMIERVGDYAKNIAKHTVAIAEGPLVVMPQMLDAMADEAHQMFNKTIDAHVSRDAQMAVEVWERDEFLDNIYSSAYRKILARMAEMPDHIAILADYLMIAKYIERIGDQSKNVAEQVYYAATGEILAEARLKAESAPVQDL